MLLTSGFQNSSSLLLQLVHSTKAFQQNQSSTTEKEVGKELLSTLTLFRRTRIYLIAKEEGVQKQNKKKGINEKGLSFGNHFIYLPEKLLSIKSLKLEKLSHCIIFVLKVDII